MKRLFYLSKMTRSYSSLEYDVIHTLASMYSQGPLPNDDLQKDCNNPIRHERRYNTRRTTIPYHRSLKSSFLQSFRQNETNIPCLPIPLIKQFDMRQFVLILYVNSNYHDTTVEHLEWKYAANLSNERRNDMTLRQLPKNMFEIAKFQYTHSESQCALVIKAESERTRKPLAITVSDLSFVKNLLFSSLEISKYVKMKTFAGFECRLKIKILRAYCQEGSGTFSKIHFMENLEEVWLDGSEVKHGFKFLKAHHKIRILSLSGTKDMREIRRRASLGNIHMNNIERFQIDKSDFHIIPWIEFNSLKYLRISDDQIRYLPPAIFIPSINVLEIIVNNPSQKEYFDPVNLNDYEYLMTLKYPNVKYLVS
jgi:hypothetical protein